jgi:hypothetical protein
VVSYPTKPGDTYTAKVIGTWPELPEFPFDTKEVNPEFYFEKDFDDDGEQTMRFGGPKGEVVVTHRDGVFTHARPDGTVLRRSVWNPDTMSYDVLEQETTEMIVFGEKVRGKSFGVSKLPEGQVMTGSLTEAQEQAIERVVDAARRDGGGGS